MIGKNLLFLLLIVSIIGNMFTLFKFLEYKRKVTIVFSEQKNSIRDIEELLATTRDNFQQSLSWQFRYDDYSINPDASLIALDDSKLFLKTAIDSGTKLIYRITTNSCDVCYDKITEKLKYACDLIGASNVIVILPIKEMRKTISAFKDQAIYAKVFAVNEEDALGIPLENSTSPFFFTVNESFKINNLLIPHKNGAEVTEDYINQIFIRYFEK